MPSSLANSILHIVLIRSKTMQI